MNDKLFNVDYLKHLCYKFSLRPSKNYGQNYLINPEVVENIIEAAQITKKDTVVEVGPGFGVLTFSLCESAKKVIAFEIEKKLDSYWEARKIENLEIVWGNVLRAKDNSFPVNYKVVANLPYQITSPVLKFFLEELEHKPKELTIMVQKEVAQRICAKPGEMSVLALSVQYFGKPEIIGEVKNDNFWPVPQVDSAMLKVITFKSTTTKAEDRAFFKFVKIGFAQKRKLLIKNLLPTIGKQYKEKFLSELKKMGFTETVRAQELSVDNWKQLVKISTLL